jgi:hypothetical protein
MIKRRLRSLFWRKLWAILWPFRPRVIRWPHGTVTVLDARVNPNRAKLPSGEVVLLQDEDWRDLADRILEALFVWDPESTAFVEYDDELNIIYVKEEIHDRCLRSR